MTTGHDDMAALAASASAAVERARALASHFRPAREVLERPIETVGRSATHPLDLVFEAVALMVASDDCPRGPATLAASEVRMAKDLWWRIVQAHRHIAVGEAKKASRKGAALPMDDLVQEALLGLFEAARRWEPARGPFHTMAGWWVRSYMGRESERTGREIRVPDNLTHALARVSRTGSTEGVGASHTSIVRGVAARRVRSLDEPVRRDGGVFGRELTRHELVGTSDRDPMDQLELSRLRDAVAKLPESQQVVIRRALEGATLADIARELGIPIDRVVTLKRQAERYLRRAIDDTHSAVERAVAMGPATTFTVARRMRTTERDAAPRLAAALAAGVIRRTSDDRWDMPAGGASG